MEQRTIAFLEDMLNVYLSLRRTLYNHSLGKRYTKIYIGKRYCRLRSTLNPMPDFLNPYRPNTCFSLGGRRTGDGAFLFNVVEDPTEQTNLINASAQVERVATMAHTLQVSPVMTCGNVSFP